MNARERAITTHRPAGAAARERERERAEAAARAAPSRTPPPAPPPGAPPGAPEKRRRAGPIDYSAFERLSGADSDEEDSTRAKMGACEPAGPGRADGPGPGWDGPRAARV